MPRQRPHPLCLDRQRFAVELVHSLFLDHGIVWVPSIVYISLFRIASEQNEALFRNMDHIKKAVATVMFGESLFYIQEYDRKFSAMSSTKEDFVNYFGGELYDIKQPFVGFNFIRHLGCVTGFALYCYSRGNLLAPDFAALAITEMLQTQRVFRMRATWQSLIEVGRRMASTPK